MTSPGRAPASTSSWPGWTWAIPTVTPSGPGTRPPLDSPLQRLLHRQLRKGMLMTPVPDPIAPERWRAAAEAISAIGPRGTVVVSGHVNPDGDALGSALALYLALAAAGNDAPRAVISFSDPFAVAPNYRFLPGLDAIVPAAEVPLDADLFVVFDTGS